MALDPLALTSRSAIESLLTSLTSQESILDSQLTSLISSRHRLTTQLDKLEQLRDVVGGIQDQAEGMRRAVGAVAVTAERVGGKVRVLDEEQVSDLVSLVLYSSLSDDFDLLGHSDESQE